MANLSDLVKDDKPTTLAMIPKKQKGRRRAWMEEDKEEVEEKSDNNEIRTEANVNKVEIKNEEKANKVKIKTEAKQNKKLSVAKFKHVDEFQVRMAKGHQRRMIEILIKNEKRAVIIEELALEMKISREHTNNLFKQMKQKGFIKYSSTYGIKYYELNPVVESVFA